jgi:hypothetical protein
VNIEDTDVSVSTAADDRPTDERLRPHAWQGRFSTTVAFPVSNYCDIVATATNALGNTGTDVVRIRMAYDLTVHSEQDPDGSAAVSFAPGCRLPQCLNPDTADSLVLTNGQLDPDDIELGGGDETAADSRAFISVLLYKPVQVAIEVVDAQNLSDTSLDRLVMHVTGPALTQEGFIPLVETTADSGDFIVETDRPGVPVIPCVFPATPPTGDDGTFIVDATATLNAVTIENLEGTDEGAINPLIVTQMQPVGTVAKPWDTLTVDDVSIESVQDPEDPNRHRAARPLMIVKRPVPESLRAYGNLIEAKSGTGTVSWTDSIARAIGMVWVAADPADIAAYGKGLDWPCVVNYGHSAGHEASGGPGNHDTEKGNLAPYEHFRGFTDDQIGKFRAKVANRGMQNAVVYLFTSDHGQTVTDHPLESLQVAEAAAATKDIQLRFHDENGYHDQVLGVIKTVPGLSDAAYLSANSPDHVPASVIFSPNGGLAYFYARDPAITTSSVAADWSTPNDPAIRDIAAALWKASSDPTTATAAGYPTFAGALGAEPVIIVRQTSAFVIPGTGGLDTYPNTYQFMALQRVVTEPTGNAHELVSLENIAQIHYDWVDFPRRIRALDDKIGSTPVGTRCGDIILVPDTRAGYVAVHEGDALPGWHGGPTKADSMTPLAIGCEALSVDGSNTFLRTLIDDSRDPEANGATQNEDMTRMVLKLFQQVHP